MRLWGVCGGASTTLSCPYTKMVGWSFCHILRATNHRCWSCSSTNLYMLPYPTIFFGYVPSYKHFWATISEFIPHCLTFWSLNSCHLPTLSHIFRSWTQDTLGIVLFDPMEKELVWYGFCALFHLGFLEKHWIAIIITLVINLTGLSALIEQGRKSNVSRQRNVIWRTK